MNAPMTPGRRGLLVPSAPFQMVRDQQLTMPANVVIDLSVPRNEQNAIEIIVSGNILYADADPSFGNCRVEFNDKGRDSTDTNYYVSPGFIGQVPFTKLRIWNDAQAGKTIKLIYGVDTPFQPGSVSQISLTGNVTIIDTVQTICQTNEQGGVSPTGAGADAAILLPAANTKGLYVRSIFMNGQAGAGGSTVAAVIASPAAPGAFNGPATCMLGRIQTPVAGSSQYMESTLSRFIPPNWGIYARHQSFVSNGQYAAAVSFEVVP